MATLQVLDLRAGDDVLYDPLDCANGREHDETTPRPR